MKAASKIYNYYLIINNNFNEIDKLIDDGKI
jgi:hypothetical protein